MATPKKSSRTSGKSSSKTKGKASAPKATKKSTKSTSSKSKKKPAPKKIKTAPAKKIKSPVRKASPVKSANKKPTSKGVVKKSPNGRSEKKETADKSKVVTTELKNHNLTNEKAQEKKSKPLTQDRIDNLRQTIITILWRKENLPVDLLKNLASTEISMDFEDEFQRYFDHVIDMLIRFNLIEEVPDRTPILIRLSQKLNV